MRGRNSPWHLSKQWLEQWHHFQSAFYKWIPDKTTLSAASRETLPDRREIFAIAMGVGRGDIGSLDFPDWLSWSERPTKGHQRHPKTVLKHVIKALRRDNLPPDCGQDEQLDENWSKVGENRAWLADEGLRQLEQFHSRLRESMPPLPTPASSTQTLSSSVADIALLRRSDLDGQDSGCRDEDADQISARIRVVSLATLLRTGFNIDQVLDGVGEVFEALVPMPDTLPGNDVGGGEKWDFLMREFPYCVFLLLDGEKVCGYWMVLPVSDDLYENGIEGKNINKSLSLLDTEEISVPGRYNLYFVDLFVLPEYRDAQSNIKLLRSFVGYLLELSRNGIFVRRIFANISSSPAEKTCMKVGFEYLRDHREHQSLKFAENGRPVPTKIYELAMLESPTLRLWDYDQDLAEAYRAERLR